MNATTRTTTLIMLRLDATEIYREVDDKGNRFEVDLIKCSVWNDDTLADEHVSLSGPAVKVNGERSSAIKRYKDVPFLDLPERFRSQLVYELTQSSLRHSMGRTL